MPVYNRADTVGRAVRSVLEQQFTDFELIVVDDGSSDQSADIVESIHDARIMVIRLGQNRGGNAARNAGIRASTGSLVAFLDSDDAYLPDKLGTVVGIFEARPELDLLVDSFIKVRRPGSLRRTKILRNKVITHQQTFLKGVFTRQLWKATPAITARRETILLAGLFDESVKRMQDLEFLVRAAAVGQCASTDKVLWQKHWTPGSISTEDSWILANVELCRRHPQHLSESAYRPGLAHAVRIGILRRLISGHLNGLRADLRRLSAAFGRRETAALVLEACLPRPRL